MAAEVSDHTHKTGKCSHETVDVDAANEAAAKAEVNIFLEPMDNSIYFESRLVQIMMKHKREYVDSNTKKEFNMNEFLTSIDPSYEFVYILDDFVLYLKEESDKKDAYTEKIYKKLIKNEDGNKCEITSCICTKRNKDQSYAKDGLEEKDIAYHSLMDNMHVHLFHSFDLALRLTSKDKEAITAIEKTIKDDEEEDKDDEKDDNVRSDRIQRRYREFIDAKVARSSFRRNTENDDKFVTIMKNEAKDQTTFRDSAMTHIVTVGGFGDNNENNANVITTWINDEEFDTDSLCPYIALHKDVQEEEEEEETKSNEPKRRMPRVALATKLKRYVNNNDPQKIHYSFGFRFYYWPFYKDNKAETNIIRVDMANKRQKKWFDPGNTNYGCCEWYIPARYPSIKEEAIESEYIDVSTWIAKQQEAKFKIKQQFCVRTTANDFWEKTYGIAADAALELRHVVAVILYTHCSKFCYNFNASFRKSSAFESASTLKLRHGAYHHTAKALREMIEVYGSQFGYSSHRVFYHGISCKMYFKTCHAKIAGPMSTTIDQTVATSIFAKDDGIVLHLVNNNDLTFFIDCDKYSCYSNEKEVLFCGGFSAIPFEAIYICADHMRLTSGIQIIAILTKMFSSASNERKIQRKQLTKIGDMIEDEVQNVSRDERKAKITAYEAELFACFCQNLEAMKFDMYLMSHDELHQGEVDEAFESKLFGYNVIYDVFFNKKFDFVKLDLALNVFPKLKRILIKSWITVQYGESADLANGLMTFVFDALSAHFTAVHKLKTIVVSLAIPMRIDNKHCPKEHELTPFNTDEDGYFCDKCDKDFAEGTAMFGCLPDGTEDECDYCVCQTCYEVENNDVKYLRQSVEQFKPQFVQQIGWNVEIAKYMDHLEHEFDAIYFTKI